MFGGQMVRTVCTLVLAGVLVSACGDDPLAPTPPPVTEPPASITVCTEELANGMVRVFPCPGDESWR